MSHENNNQYTSPTPPSEAIQVPVGEMIGINMSMPLFGVAPESGRNNGGGTVVGDISLQEQWAPNANVFSVLQVRGTHEDGSENNRLILSKVLTDEQGNKSYARETTVELLPGETTLTERHTAGLGMTNRLAGSVNFECNDITNALFITNAAKGADMTLEAQAGATWAPFGKPKERPQDVWVADAESFDYTMNADQARELVSRRHQIGRDRPIEGGEYTTANHDPKTGQSTFTEEIITVNTEAHPDNKKMYDDLKAKALKFAEGKQGITPEEAKLIGIKEVVKAALPYSLENVDELLKKAIPDGNGGIRNGGKIDLSYFVDEKIGICRHQALLAGKIGELMKAGHELPGNVSVDRNALWNPLRGETGGHAWMRYTTTKGEVYIVDPAQDFFGRLNEVPKGIGKWNYLRPEEQKAASAAGSAAAHGVIKFAS